MRDREPITMYYLQESQGAMNGKSCGIEKLSLVQNKVDGRAKANITSLLTEAGSQWTQFSQVVCRGLSVMETLRGRSSWNITILFSRVLQGLGRELPDTTTLSPCWLYLG